MGKKKLQVYQLFLTCPSSALPATRTVYVEDWMDMIKSHFIRLIEFELKKMTSENQLQV